MTIQTGGIERKLGSVFITGGSGFMGRELIQALSHHGCHDIRVLVRSNQAAAAIPKVDGIRLIHGDLSSVDAMTNGMMGCTHVFHLAACVNGSAPLWEARRDNVLGTQNVVTSARHAGVARVVYCSTEAVLIGGGDRVIRDADETWPIPSIDGSIYPYSKSKAEAETWLLQANTAETETVAIRPRFIWGRGDTVVLPDLMRGVLGNGFSWIDQGTYRTSRCHVRNACEGAICAALRGRGGQTYFLTDGAAANNETFRSFMTRLFATQGWTKPITWNIPFWIFWIVSFIVEWTWWLMRAFHLTKFPKAPLSRQVTSLICREVTVLDTKARRELGYRGLVDTDTGLRELAEDYIASHQSKKPP